jgi:glycosyltransferase involved in cell wall biosynthesis
VLPCFNEAENLKALLDEISLALHEVALPYEVIVVDDGSTDDSAATLAAIAAACPELRAIHHRANFGQSAAVLTGCEAARGDVVVTMDCDGQNDPADLPAMLALLANCDAVCGVRATRRDTAVKRLSSRIANGVRRLVLGDGIHDAGCTFRAIRRECLQQLPAFRGLHRFVPTILRFHGCRVEEMQVNHRPRLAGVSKYGVLGRLWVGIDDMMAMRWYRRRHFATDRVSPRGSQEPTARGAAPKKRR